jgi:hypothetical protein
MRTVMKRCVAAFDALALEAHDRAIDVLTTGRPG